MVNMAFKSWLLKEERIGLNHLDEEQLQALYQVFHDSYMKSAGEAFDWDTFMDRAQNWTFFGRFPWNAPEDIGFVAVRFQASGLAKMTGMAGDLKGIDTGIQELLSLGKPTWGVVPDKFARLAEKKYKSFGLRTTPPEVVSKLPFQLRMLAKGAMISHPALSGSMKKQLIGNAAYWEWLQNQDTSKLDVGQLTKALGSKIQIPGAGMAGAVAGGIGKGISKIGSFFGGS